MTKEEILKLRDHGEVTKVQFKERIIDNYDTGCELVAFSNYHGGVLVIGINDKTGVVNPLSFLEVQETTNLLGNIASENVIPGILLYIETVAIDDGQLVVATIKEGLNKPYHDNKGIVWVKNGADKRRVFDNSELAEMMSQCGNFAPDEASVSDISLRDFDEHVIKTYLLNRFAVVMGQKGINELNLRDYTLEQMTQFVAGNLNVEGLLRNLRFIRPDGKFTVAAVMLFAKHPQRWLPAYTAKCICFAGKSIGGTVFRDKVRDTDMEGCLSHLFDTIMSFFTRNLRNVQVEHQVEHQVKHQVEHQVKHQVEHQITNEITNQVQTSRPQLTKSQKDIVNFCSVPRTAQEILNRLGVYNQSRSRKKHIQPLLEMGVLEMTNPDKPSASNQKYRKVRR